MLGLAIAIIVASFSFQLQGDGAIAVGQSHWRLPPFCGSRTLLGVDCPGCGLTRSFVALAHGDLTRSLQFHRLGWLVAVCVAAQIPYRALSLAEMRVRSVQREWPLWLACGLTAVLLVNWLLKATGY
jgi:hypothetical protein